MTTATDLRAKISGILHPMTHALLDVEPKRIGGLEIPRGEGLSKNQRIDAALDQLSEREMAQFALKLAEERGDVGLDEAGRKVLETSERPLTRITRRDVARVFGDDLSGEADLLELVGRYFVIVDPWEEAFGGSGKSLRDKIDRHMVRNPGDWSVELLFGEIGAFDCSRARFAALLQEAVHPLARSGEEQLKTVAALNKVLARDGYELAADGEESGHPIYAFRPIVRGVEGRPKNLIFASRGPKPELGFADAINNDIVILSGEESCLVYDRPIGNNGVLWSDLVTWWSEKQVGSDAVGLGKRLQESLASAAEKKLFATYFKAYRTALGDALPALLPQVYLHYDPAVVKTLRHRLPLPRQRMDFLLLLPGRQRIVIEVDGKHHFSEGEMPSLKVYSEMVSADRELRLAGYEVYRFGANELVGDGAEKVIQDLFDKLFRLHRVNAG
ncbi:AbiJ-related protein [Mesorhizobium sp. 43Arga]